MRLLLSASAAAFVVEVIIFLISYPNRNSGCFSASFSSPSFPNHSRRKQLQMAASTNTTSPPTITTTTLPPASSSSCSSSMLSVSGYLDNILGQDPAATVLSDTDTRSRVQHQMDTFLSRRHRKDYAKKRKFDGCGTSSLSSSLAESAIETAHALCDISTKGDSGVSIRRSLEQASMELLLLSEGMEETDTITPESQTAMGFLSLALVAVALALNNSTDQSQHCRAVASAMACTIQRQATSPSSKAGKQEEQRSDNKVHACYILQALFLCSANQFDREQMLHIDWHIVTSMAQAFGMKGADKEVAQAVSTIISQTLQLNNNNDASEVLVDVDILPDKAVVSSILALAAQLRPWEKQEEVGSVVSPSQLILAGVPFDLWHKAERVCASAVSTQHSKNASSLSLEAVETLVDAAIEAKRYRQADTYATRFYDIGIPARYLKARLLHACDTVAKASRRESIALSIIQKQIDRIDKASEKVLGDGAIDASAADEARSKIRTFALEQLQEAGHEDTAHRLAEVYGLDYARDEQAIAKAAEARRKKYLQWTDVMPTGNPIPELFSSPEALLNAFSKTDLCQGVFGFDVEWSDDDKGADLLQIATFSDKNYKNPLVLLIDVPALSMTVDGANALEKTVGRLFAANHAIKVGFACRQDVTRLQSSPTIREQHWFQKSTSVSDLQKQVGKKTPSLRNMGLSRACQHYLGKPLDKSEQCSFWSARPLSVQQRTYAALDAWVCLAIYHEIESNEQTAARREKRPVWGTSLVLLL